MTKCRHCGERRDVRTGSHFGGGSYKRAGRMYAASICEECARRLVAQLTPGHRRVAGWDILTLRRVWAITPD